MRMTTRFSSSPCIFVLAIFGLITNGIECVNYSSSSSSSSQSFNASAAGSSDGFGNAVATWYGAETGAGGGGACGFADDVGEKPYFGFISAGNRAIFKSGTGCGECYQVKCTDHPSCSGSPITVTITDECPGACNDQPVHFDLSGRAFGSLAKPGQDFTLRKAGIINIQYQRVQCFHNSGITLKIDPQANKYYLAFAIENVDGDGSIGRVELLPSNSQSWVPAVRSWGAVWRFDVYGWMRGPYGVRITTLDSQQTVTLLNAIPADWAPGQYYRSAYNIAAGAGHHH